MLLVLHISLLQNKFVTLFLNRFSKFFEKNNQMICRDYFLVCLKSITLPLSPKKLNTFRVKVLCASVVVRFFDFYV